MPEVAVSAPGTPTWIDVSTKDVDGAVAFYEGVFGWQTVDPGPDAGGYRLFKKNGKDVAGIGPTQDPNQPPAWSVYIATENADATAEKVKQAGGNVIAPPFDVLKSGRMAVFQDPTGAFISVWQANEMKGSELMDEPGTLAWAELNTRGVDNAKGFYKQVFGWGDKTSESQQGQPPYTEWQLNGKSIAGGMEIGPSGINLPAQVPPHWLVYIGSADVDATTKKAKDLGGKVNMEPADFPGGRFSVITDPTGAVFGILKMSPSS